MKRILLSLAVVVVLGGAIALSGSRDAVKDFFFPLEERNPVSHLKFNDHAKEFQFALVSDRTGGHRANVFSQAVEKLNLLQPAFVLSVGDLIEGGNKKPVPMLKAEWEEFDSFVGKLQMPFFYVPGNHDTGAAATTKFWKGKLGPTYYHFVHGNVLFLLLNSDDPPGSNGNIGPEQIAFAKKILNENKSVRWTIVVVHRPLWAIENLKSDADASMAKNGWGQIETALRGRRYTVFSGHVHKYKKFVRNGQNYYQLATTGGSSLMRGPEYGEFDQIAWVTMKMDGPLLANILIDDVLSEDLQRPITNEPVARNKQYHEVKGRAFFEGAPMAGAKVVLHNANNPNLKNPTGTVRADGSFQITTNIPNDGALEGEYIVTATWKKGVLPGRYADAATSELRASVRADNINDLMLELKK